MGLVNAEVTLRNPRKPELSPVTVTALVDSETLHLCLPEHIRIQLELEESGQEGGHPGGRQPRAGSVRRPGGDSLSATALDLPGPW